MLKLLTFFTPVLFIFIACNPKKINSNPTAIDRLMAGNEKYLAHQTLHPNTSEERLKQLSSGQNPFAIVVSCSDSRVAPELVFNQGLGDLFVIRTAGHAIGNYELASIEYAVEHLDVKNIIVLGHESCGAIKALMDHPEGHLPGHIDSLVCYLRAETEQQAVLKNKNCTLKEAILANVQHAVRAISTSDPILKEKVAARHLNVYGAYYHLNSGKVDLLPTSPATLQAKLTH